MIRLRSLLVTVFGAGLTLSAAASAGPDTAYVTALHADRGVDSFIQKVDHRHHYDRHRYPYYKRHHHYRPYHRYYDPPYYRGYASGLYYPYSRDRYHYDRYYYDRYDDDDDELLWYGLGVMTPLLLDSLYGY